MELVVVWHQRFFAELVQRSRYYMMSQMEPVLMSIVDRCIRRLLVPKWFVTGPS